MDQFRSRFPLSLILDLLEFCLVLNFRDLFYLGLVNLRIRRSFIFEPLQLISLPKKRVEIPLRTRLILALLCAALLLPQFRSLYCESSPLHPER